VGPRRSALAGFVQLALVVGGLLCLHSSELLSPITAFALLGVAGALIGGGLVISLKPGPAGSDGIGPEARELHRSYGRWSAGTALLTWIPGQVYYLVLPAAGAVAAAGNLRALMNLILPLLQVFVALSTILTTGLARLAGSDRHAVAVRLAGLGFFLVAVMYGLALTLFGGDLLHWIYGGRYDANAPLLPMVALLPILGVGVTVFAPALRSLERPDRVFVAYSASTVVSLTFGLWVTIRYGVPGSIAGLAATTSTTSGFLWYAYRVARREGFQSVISDVAPDPMSTTTQSESW
jgi:O-antigen/teichoic acid export membrane protein